MEKEIVTIKSVTVFNNPLREGYSIETNVKQLPKNTFIRILQDLGTNLVIL